MIDFSRIQNKEIKYADLAEGLTIQNLRDATNESVDLLVGLVQNLTDEQINFVPIDHNAHDPYAQKEEEVNMGWTVGHLILHVTASSEEGAAFASILGRGIVVGGRLRYEPDWQDPRYTTTAGILQRLEESRRIRLAYLDAIPDEPHLDVYREMSERFEAIVGKLNAIGSFLLGLGHEVDHYDQIREAIRQAQETSHAQA